MLIDFQQPTLMAGSIVTFENVATASLPKQPQEIRETILLRGSDTRAQSRTGTTDQPE